MKNILGWFTRRPAQESVSPRSSEAPPQPDSSLPRALILAEGKPLPLATATLSLFTPDGEIIANPSDELLSRLTLEMDWEETWGDDGMVNFAWFMHTPSGVLLFNSVPDKPELFFFARKPYGFYFIYRDPDGRESIPDNGSASTEQISHGLGGNPYLFAATGFVPPATALAILREFARSATPDPTVKWVEASPLSS